MKSATTKPSDNFLTTRNIEFLLSSVFQHHRATSGTTAIDLSDILFFDPYALVMLLLAARQMTPAPSITLPHHPSTLQYLKTIGFLSAINKSPGTPAEKGASSAPVLLKITEIAHNDDVRNTVGTIIDSVQHVLHAHLNYKSEDAGNLLNALAELCQNIVDHSESSGLAAMQVYTSQRGAKYAVIGVGDGGIGIRESLSKRYDTKTWTDSIAIRNALKPHVSRFKERGLGLTRVKEIAEKYNGTLLLRSNKGLVQFQRRITSRTTIPFAGTQIAIYLRENRRLL